MGMAFVTDQKGISDRSKKKGSCDRSKFKKRPKIAQKTT
jgi:hypothetical protein